jgi:acylphosphatase
LKTAKVRLLVSGRVQGVCFRQSTQEVAARLGVRGWVRNLADGRVVAVGEGPREALVARVAFCGRGPPAARVEGIEVRWGEAGEALGRFEVRP